ncbi:MAG: hypothetical protein GXO25_06685 [Euryarchaeota archaeon]|nr:hypothetical protein [Euryarchaeota archaeon]
MKVALTVINLLIAALFFSVIYSAANVDVSFDVGAVRSNGFTLQGDNLVTAFPVKINNGGLYPISNVSIFFVLKNGTSVIYQHTFTISQIPALKTYEKTFVLTMNLTKIYRKLGTYYIFHRGKFTINIFINAHYWYIADFTARYTRNISWNPLIYTFTFYKSQIKITGDLIKIPYFISKLPIPLSAKMKLNVTDSQGTIASGITNVVFDKKSMAILHLSRNCNFLLTHSDNWEIHYTLITGAFKVHGLVHYTWIPPLSHLHIYQKIINGTPYLMLGFKNNMMHQLKLTIKGTVYNANSTSEFTKVIVTKAGASANIPIALLTPDIKGISMVLYMPEYGIQYTLNYGEVGS